MRAGASIHSLIARELRGKRTIRPDTPAHLREMLEGFRASRFNTPPIASERPFLLSLPRGDVRGRIDLVLPRADGGVELVDFKSGHVQSREDAAAHLQLPLYALAVSSMLNRPPEEVSYTYYYLRSQLEHSFTPAADTFEALRARVDAILTTVQAGRFSGAPGCTCFACRRLARNGPVVTKPQPDPVDTGVELS